MRWYLTKQWYKKKLKQHYQQANYKNEQRDAVHPVHQFYIGIGYAVGITLS